MTNSLIVMKDGSDVQGQIMDTVFNFQSGEIGNVSNTVNQVSQVNIGVFSGDSPDQMFLMNQDEYRGHFLNPTVTIKLSEGGQVKTIQSAVIKTIMVHNDIDE
jgi:hypothetical protein